MYCWYSPSWSVNLFLLFSNPHHPVLCCFKSSKYNQSMFPWSQFCLPLWFLVYDRLPCTSVWNFRHFSPCMSDYVFDLFILVCCLLYIVFDFIYWNCCFSCYLQVSPIFTIIILLVLFQRIFPRSIHFIYIFIYSLIFVPYSYFPHSVFAMFCICCVYSGLPFIPIIFPII